ncbi:unnamed protein product, partial [Gulo gulo]
KPGAPHPQASHPGICARKAHQGKDPHPCPHGFPFRVRSGCVWPWQMGPSQPHPTPSQPVIKRRLPGQCRATSHSVLSPPRPAVTGATRHGEWRHLQKETPASREEPQPAQPQPVVP